MSPFVSLPRNSQFLTDRKIKLGNGKISWYITLILLNMEEAEVAGCNIGRNHEWEKR
jgi:hypothetical protein